MKEESYGIGDIVTDRRTNEQYKIVDMNPYTLKLEKVGTNHVKLIGVKLFLIEFKKNFESWKK